MHVGRNKLHILLYLKKIIRMGDGILNFVIYSIC